MSFLVQVIRRKTSLKLKWRRMYICYEYSFEMFFEIKVENVCLYRILLLNTCCFFSTGESVQCPVV